MAVGTVCLHSVGHGFVGQIASRGAELKPERQLQRYAAWPRIENHLDAKSEAPSIQFVSARFGGAFLSMLAACAMLVAPLAQADAKTIAGSTSSAPSSKFSKQMDARPPASALRATPGGKIGGTAATKPNPFAATMSARPPTAAVKAAPAAAVASAAAGAAAATAVSTKAALPAATPAPAAKPPAPPATAVSAPAPLAAAPVPAATPAPAPAPAKAPEPQTIVNNKTIIREKTIVVQAPEPPPVVIAPPSPFGGTVVAAPAPVYVEAAPPPSFTDVAVQVGAAMAVKAVADAVMPSPEKVMQDQIRKDERELDKQSEQIRQLQSQLAELKK